jgi:hypothetical protein
MRQTSCKHCGFDIEGAGREWRDRGANTQCPEFCGWDENGIPVDKPRRKHQPQSTVAFPIRPTRSVGCSPVA